MPGYRIKLGLALFLIAPAASAETLTQTCEALTGLKLPNTTVTMAQSKAAGTFVPPGSDPGTKGLPIAVCRVGGSIKPVKDSNIRFEVWLPQKGWTGRYEAFGNSGFAGMVPSYMTGPLLAGSAVAGTNDGHEDPTGLRAEWALKHPEKITDYGYRAVHLVADISKAIISVYYGSKPKHSYFIGCSKGGQEGLMEAQRYPDDFDGILAGAPANQWTKWMSSLALNMKTNMASAAAYVSQTDAKKIGAAITEQCDGLDGVKDGLIGDPRQCRINVRSLPLTSAQRRTYQTLHDGPRTRSGRSIYPGLPYGSEAVGWDAFITGPDFTQARAQAAQSVFATGFFANFIYQNPGWDFLSFNLESGPSEAERLAGPLNAANPNLAAFKARGGKIISYHGWSDALITPLGTLDYYNAVVAAQEHASSGTPNADALKKAQDFYRLFMAPGMSHCGGGPGPNEFGQGGGDGDAEHNIVAALEQWVEKGVAPNRIIATKYVGDDPQKGVAMTRPLCVYPQVAKYRGTGDAKNAGSFLCAAP